MRVLDLHVAAATAYTELGSILTLLLHVEFNLIHNCNQNSKYDKRSCLLNENNRRLLQALYGAGKAVAQHRVQDAEDIAASYRAKMSESLAFLARDLPICRELGPWIAKYKTACRIIDRLFDYILTPAHDGMRKDINDMIDVYASDPTVLIHEFVFREILLDRYLM